MLSGAANYPKLKINLRIVINRLKLLEKKKTELAQKARREIADYIANNKLERAKIRVEHIIREDYMVEAMELVEMYCDLLLARFGLIQQMKTMDEGLAEAISSLMWVCPRMQADVVELKVVVDQLTTKYGKPYAQAARDNSLEAVNPRLVHKLSVQAPPKLLVEKYLIEIAKSHNVEYEPDQQVLLQEQEQFSTATNLIDFGAAAANLPPMPATSPFVMPTDVCPESKEGPPPLPTVPPSGPYANVASPPPPGFAVPGTSALPPFPLDLDPSQMPQPPPTENNLLDQFPEPSSQEKPVPAPRSIKPSPADSFPELPSVPNSNIPNLDNSNNPSNDKPVDFDDLARRFEELKNKK